VVDKALAFEKADRWSDAAAMDEALVAAYEAGFGGKISDVLIDVPPLGGESAEVPRFEDLPAPAPSAARAASDGSTELLTAGATRSMPRASLPVPRTAPLRKPIVVSASVVIGALGAIALLSFAGTALLRRATTTAAMTAPLGAAAECARATECVAKLGGQAAVCHAGKCAAVEGTGCKALYEPGDLKRDDTVWIGAMFPGGRDAPRWGLSNANAVELARRDFAQASASLLASTRPAGVRSLAVVQCDSTTGDSATRHLVDDLGVPAVLGHFGVNPLDLQTALFVPHDVLTIATINMSPLLRSVPHAPGQSRMVWRTTYDNSETARAIAALVGRLEASSPRRGETSVAVVRPKNVGNSAFAESLFEALRFNGKSALDNGGRYRELSFETPAEEYSAVTKEVAQFAPTFVVAVASAEAIREIEGIWPAGKPRATYLLPFTFGPELFALLDRNADLRHRVFGVSPVSTRTANARFVVHYNETFPSPITRAIAPNTSYDAMYLVGYATYAIGRGHVDGRSLSHALARLVPPGLSVDVGPGGILTAVSALANGGSIDLNGATGDLDFDLATGESQFDFAVLCAGVDASGAASDAIESGLVYDWRGRSLVGEPRCP
jgi:hypothetical protein